MHNHGLIRVASAVPEIKIADIRYNTTQIKTIIDQAADDHVRLLVFPELCLSGYTCADLFMHTSLQEEAIDALTDIAAYTLRHPDMAVIIGLPLAYNNALYNCGALLGNGKIHGIVPKTYLPNYNEFYEKRWFASSATIQPGSSINIQNTIIPFGTDIIFDIAGIRTSIEICEDLWTPLPPSTMAALAGAVIIANLSATNEVAAKHDYLESMIQSHSGRLQAAYVYSSAGVGESTTDLVYGGNAIIAENGRILTHSPRFTAKQLYECCDIDAEALLHDRRVHNSFADNAAYIQLPAYRIIDTQLSTPPLSPLTIMRPVNADPFVPQDPAQRRLRCREIVNIQAEGLMQRLKATGMKSITVGISGGLDSTLAILVAHYAFQRLDLPAANIIGVTMPGFGTTSRTYNNAKDLIKLLGATLREISIADATIQHFKDIDHDLKIHNLTYENSQARERTQILMDVSGQHGGMVLGTGDLSELALGWCTYNGDHMSMYGINASIPKTLVRHLVEYFAQETDSSQLARVLRDIIDTPVSPELIPATDDDQISQKTEDLVGPYALHDFFIYQTLRYGFRPSKVYLLACKAFENTYKTETIKHWLKTFYRRFFTQQFKRSCMPDSPKVGSICLSPRGDWRMPSDASFALWLNECDNL